MMPFCREFALDGVVSLPLPHALALGNNIIFYIEVQVRQEREALLVAAARKASRY
jgi:hypothetical protein